MTLRDHCTAATGCRLGTFGHLKALKDTLLLTGTLVAWLLAPSAAFAEPPDTDRASLHFEALWAHIDRVSCGSYDLKILCKRRTSAAPYVISGRHSFNLVTNEAAFDQMGREERPMYWSRNGEVQYLYVGVGGDPAVSIYDKNTDADVAEALPPYDFHELAMAIPSTFSVGLPPVSLESNVASKELVSTEASEDTFTVTLHSPTMTLEEAVEASPPEMRTPLRKLIDEFGPEHPDLPIKRGKTIIRFDGRRLGVVKEYELWISPYGEDEWSLECRTRNKWATKNGCLVPVEIRIAGARQLILVTLNWLTVNEKCEELDFGIHNVPQLQGRALIDARLPEAPAVGVVGDGTL